MPGALQTGREAVNFWLRHRKILPNGANACATRRSALGSSRFAQKSLPSEGFQSEGEGLDGPRDVPRWVQASDDHDP